MLRCAYQDETKVVWDSHGNVVVYEYDPKAQEWHRQSGDTVPDWASDLFDEDFDAIGDGLTDEGTPDIDAATESRLKELGYLE